MSTELILNVTNKLGTLRATANNITLYSLEPKEVDESYIKPLVTLNLPTLDKVATTITGDNNIFDNPESFTSLKNIAKIQSVVAYEDLEYGHAQAIIPDWVDVYTDDIPKQPWQHTITVQYPSVSDVSVSNYSNITVEGGVLQEGNVAIQFPDKPDISCDEYTIGKIGKSSWIVKCTDEIFVERCDGIVDIIKQSSIDMAPPVAIANVLTRVDVEIDVGNHGGGGGDLKSFEILSNKNNYIDIYIEMDNIMRVENLPSGLVYENNHVKGVPTQSGLFISTIIIGTPTAGITAKYTMRFKVPVFERLL